MEPVKITVTNGDMTEGEQQTHIRYIENKYPGKQLTSINFKIDGDYVDIEYHFKPRDFERIRRITGYLVGTLDHWNNGKRAEEKDRVKHDVMEKI